MRRSILACIVSLVPLAGQAQAADNSTPAPVPSISPNAGGGGDGTLPPERIAPVTPGAVGDAPAERDGGNRDRDAPGSSVPPSR